jgi:hypothetical protein
MAYVNPNFPSKKALKDAVGKGITVEVFNPGLGGEIPPNAKGVAIEGPHYPKPHRWYAQVDLENGRVIKVK